MPRGASHAVHAGTFTVSGQRAYACRTCHLGADHLNHAQPALHADHAIQVGIAATVDGNGGSGNYTGNAAPGNAYGYCYTVTCHSDGVIARESPARRTGAVFDTVTWGGTLACGACHAAVPITGSHRTHVAASFGPRMDCGGCHPQDAFDGEYSSDYQSRTHADGAVQFAKGSTVTPLSGTQVCAACHGNDGVGTELTAARGHWYYTTNTSLDRWAYAATAAVEYCTSCHDATPGQVSSPAFAGTRTGPNRTAFYKANQGGHGFSGTLTASGRASARYRCSVCHRPGDAGHFDAGSGDDDRLRAVTDGVAYTSTKSDLCLDCHKVGGAGGTLGRDAQTEVRMHSRMVTVSTKFDAIGTYNYQCSACHSPHGTRNLAMVLATINGGMGGGNWAVAFTTMAAQDPT